MGVIANEVFLTLEEAMARMVRFELGAAFEDALREAQAAIDRNDFDTARAMVEGLTSIQVMQDLDTFLETKMIQAALFGASQFGDPEDSVLMGGEGLDLVRGAVDQFKIGIEESVSSQLKLEANRQIAFIERLELQAQDRVALEKADFGDKWFALINGKKNALVDIGSNLSTSRLIQFGFLSEAQARGVVRYQVSEVLDGATCQFCRRIHGRVFDVKPAAERLNRLLRTLDPKELAQAAPFPKQDKKSLAAFDKMNKKQMEAQGFNSPPYHPFCRGILVKVGTVRRGDVARAGLRPAKIREKPPVVDAAPDIDDLTATQLLPTDSDNFDGGQYAKLFDDPNANQTALLLRRTAAERKALRKIAADIDDGLETVDVYKVGGVYTQERKALHKKIIRDILEEQDSLAKATAPAGEQPTFVTFGGRGGSGKSWFTKKGDVIDKNKFLVMDADNIKERLPGYDGWNAFHYHQESSHIFELMTRYARAKNLNIVHDSTLKDTSKALKRLEQFAANGYRFEGYYMHLPRQEAAFRAIDRAFSDTKRFVPPEVVLSNVANEVSFDQIRGFFEKWAFYDNQVPRGFDPILVSSSKNYVPKVVSNATLPEPFLNAGGLLDQN